MTDIVETVARAFFEFTFKENGMLWDDHPESHVSSRARARSALAALEAAGLSLVPSESVDWQPMETAPRNGRLVDLNVNRTFRLCDCKWGKEEPHLNPTWLHYRPFPDALHDWGWQEALVNIADATHWRPVPIPPEEG